jgi:extracellular factor (EF) 3-hydroxypalmitic acid methyl ester biosynthesis protein
MATQNGKAESETAGSFVSFQNSQGLELQGTLLKMSRFQAAFEIYSALGVLRLSESIKNLRIRIQGQLLYSGRAVVTNLIHLGSVLVCETALDEAGLDVSAACPVNDRQALHEGFEKFLTQCSRNFKVQSEFKVVVADLQMLLLDLRLWMEQMELTVRSEPSGDRLQMEREILQALQVPVLPPVALVLEKFEALANQVEADFQPAHRAYMRRQIHPVVMCSPFLYRTFQKPLGYAGDYEMVNMMLRDPFEGGSMFAKLVNRIFLNTSPVVAHQNRITYLTDRLRAEAGRAAARHQPFRVYNVGCGPAREVQDFLAQCEWSSRAEFTLLDFNEETLAFTTNALGQLNRLHHRANTFQFVKKSVHQLLKEAGKPIVGPKHHFVYCAGLFDYLSDPACRRLLELLYELVEPGGLLVATIVSTANPSRNWMEHVLDWHLLYRNAAQLKALAPGRASGDCVSVQAIGDGVNMSLEIRKPDNAN